MSDARAIRPPVRSRKDKVQDMTPYLLMRRLGFFLNERPPGIPPKRNTRWLTLVILADAMLVAGLLTMVYLYSVWLGLALLAAGFALHMSCAAWSRRQHRLA